ncbi:MAG: hypothetical protein HY681_04245 [Chloroflexi bacterium]|nr:hypothetical protein [Chloroflexota bacterium]
MEDKVMIRDLFEAKQREMMERLLGGRRVVNHPGEKGAATEENWRDLFASYLPNRCQVGNPLVVDVDGQQSEQLDLVLFDQQYSPVLFETGGLRFIPAENVYAVFEVRQEMNRENVVYAANKIASVRRLRRTSAPIKHAGGQYEPREPLRIVGGILTTTSEWLPPFGQAFLDTLRELPEQGRLDLGCALQHGTFRANYERGGEVKVEANPATVSLISFVFKLLQALQQMGTVPAIDFTEWLRHVQ